MRSLVLSLRFAPRLQCFASRSANIQFSGTVISNMFHIRRTCKSVTKGEWCGRREKGGDCGYGHNRKELRRFVDARRKARADGRRRVEEASAGVPRQGQSLSKGQRARQDKAAKKAALQQQQ